MLWNAVNGEVKVRDSEMYYVSFGHGAKKLVILPGLSDGLATVKGKALMLAGPYKLFFDKYTVYMFSRKNEMPSGYSIRNMAYDQALAMRSLGMDKASVLGVSEGGMIAQYLAVDHPELVEKLVIAVSAPNAGKLARECVSRWLEIAEKNDHKSLMIDTAENSYSPARLEKYRKMYPVLGFVGKPKSYDRFRVNANAILWFDARSDIHKISCPTLIIAGEDDKIVGVDASYEMNWLIEGSSLFVYPGLGHALYEEAPDFNRRVYDFLEEN